MPGGVIKVMRASESGGGGRSGIWYKPSNAGPSLPRKSADSADEVRLKASGSSACGAVELGRGRAEAMRPVHVCVRVHVHG